jgi:hypothetical protein
VKDFELINWQQYNKPPYWPQWLCKGDPLSLVSFGDSSLADIDRQIQKLKDIWDIDNLQGLQLDRVGKLLGVTRAGNTDEYYRINLKLRVLLNSSTGTVNSIIKVIKFIYSSEIVHIVPDYPAGIIIEHDGEGTPGLNFNRILAEIVPAGVSFYTKELFDFFEELESTDNQLIQLHYDNPKEEFEGRIYHNRRILRDGHTILPTELKRSFHNGTQYHNGFIRYNGRYETEATSYIRFPLIRESGYRDSLALLYELGIRDFQISQLFHNGTITYQGYAKHNGRSTHSMSDTISVFAFNQLAIDNFHAGESSQVNITVYDSDRFRKPYFHDGRQRHNSVMFHSGWALDFLALVQNLLFQDTAAGSTYHNGILRHNGSEKHTGLGNTYAYEKQSLNMGFQFNENIPVIEDYVLRIENNTTEFSLLSEKMAMQIELSPFEETQSVYDSFALGIRYHHFHNGDYVRNNRIKHNAGVLIPL